MLHNAEHIASLDKYIKENKQFNYKPIKLYTGWIRSNLIDIHDFATMTYYLDVIKRAIGGC